MDGEGEKLAKVVAHTVDRDYMVEDPEFDRIGFTMMLDPISDVRYSILTSDGVRVRKLISIFSVGNAAVWLSLR